MAQHFQPSEYDTTYKGYQITSGYINGMYVFEGYYSSTKQGILRATREELEKAIDVYSVLVNPVETEIC